MTLRLDWCGYDAARYATEHWHYSKSMPTPPVIRIGVWEDEQFIGCVLFSRGSTNNLGKPYGLDVIEVCELTRVALSNHKAPVSKVLGIALRMLRSKEKGLRLIVSFADPDENHHGGIYQATNWIYAGQSESYDKFRDKNGRVWHPRQVSKTGYKKQYGEYRRVPTFDDCERIHSAGKYRYLYPLDDAMRKQIEPLRKPYPKRDRGETDSAPQSNAETEGASPIRSLSPIRRLDA
jgi:hypothetical protein